MTSTEVILSARPDSDADLHFVTDATDRAVGGALYQAADEAPCPLAFYFRKITLTEQGYSTFSRELLAIANITSTFCRCIFGNSKLSPMDNGTEATAKGSQDLGCGYLCILKPHRSSLLGAWQTSDAVLDPSSSLQGRQAHNPSTNPVVGDV
ncbi:unnamed protein product, partial [Protopolystoma xenopodis]